MTTLPLVKLIEDLDLYPRTQVSDNHVADLAAALEAGDTLPPPVVDRKSKRIIDGWHRVRAHRKVFGPDASIDVELRTYKSEADMFVAGVELNVGHGLKLSAIEQRRVALRLSESGNNSDVIGVVLHIPPAKVQRILVRVATVTEGGGTVRLEALKRPLIHFSGKQITEAQAKAMRSAPGTRYSDLVRQLRDAMRFALLDTNDANLMADLEILAADIAVYLAEREATA